VQTGPEISHGFPNTYIYDYVTKLCRQQAKGMQNHKNANVRDIGRDETRHRKCKWPKLGGGQADDHSNY
jgi:hypothetical protein